MTEVKRLRIVTSVLTSLTGKTEVQTGIYFTISEAEAIGLHVPKLMERFPDHALRGTQAFTILDEDVRLAARVLSPEGLS